MNIVAAIALTLVVSVGTALLSATVGMGVTLLLPLALVSAGWVAWDAHDIGLAAHRSRLAQTPAVLFVVVAVFWPVAFPWYLVTRAKLRAGVLARRAPAPATNGFAPVTPVGALTSTSPPPSTSAATADGGHGAAARGAVVAARRPSRPSWVAAGRVAGVVVAFAGTGLYGYFGWLTDSLFEPVLIVAIRGGDEHREPVEVGLVPVSGRWVTRSLPDGWRPIASADEFNAVCAPNESGRSLAGCPSSRACGRSAQGMWTNHRCRVAFGIRRVIYNEYVDTQDAGSSSTDEYEVFGQQVRPLRHFRHSILSVMLGPPALLVALGIAVWLLRPVFGALAGFVHDRRHRIRASDEQRPSS